MLRKLFIPLNELKIHNWVRLAFGTLISSLALALQEYGMLWMGGALLLAGLFGRRGCHGEVCDI